MGGKSFRSNVNEKAETPEETERIRSMSKAIAQQAIFKEQDMKVSLRELAVEAASEAVVRGGWDNLQATWARNGKPTRRTLVLGSQVWAGKLDRLKQWPDASLYTGELGSSWDAYTRVLAPFAERLILTYQETVEHEGRSAWVYQASLAPAADPKRGLVPRALSGTVTLDKATAVRLHAEVQGSLWDPELDCERLVTVNISRSEIGIPPDLAAPAPSTQR